jgi:calcineurin-like phosphoesterase family protein
MSNVFFISDLHLGHRSILSFRSEVHKRLFSNENEMNEWIIDNINSVVRPKDILWILGDLWWGSDSSVLYNQINGRKRAILGNHDNGSILEYHRYFDKIYGVWKKYNFVMSHIPIHPKEMEFRNWGVNVHGHIHHKERDLGFPYINVNMDIIGPKPISLDEIREIIKQNES